MVTQKFRKNVVKRIRIKGTDDKYRPSNAEISAISQAKFLGSKTVKYKQSK